MAINQSDKVNIYHIKNIILGKFTVLFPTGIGYFFHVKLEMELNDNSEKCLFIELWMSEYSRKYKQK